LTQLKDSSDEEDGIYNFRKIRSIVGGVKKLHTLSKMTESEQRHYENTEQLGMYMRER
jgi:hypothetical protein